MKHLLLERQPTTPNETEGFLSWDKAVLATMERPWKPTDVPGGEPFRSCVPVGSYELLPHTRPDGKAAFALVNPALGVHYLQEDVPAEGGRYLILIHAGNWVSDVVGCIAPGLGKGPSDRGPMVKSSVAAMAKLLEYIGGDHAELRWIN